jgi:hypothetical protein
VSDACVLRVVALLVRAQDVGVIHVSMRDPMREEQLMSGLPHPATMAKLAEQRRVELHAEARRARRASLAQPHAGRRQLWSDLAALRGVAATLTAVLAAFHRG